MKNRDALVYPQRFERAIARNTLLMFQFLTLFFLPEMRKKQFNTTGQRHHSKNNKFSEEQR